MKKLSEEAWIKKHLSRRTWAWDELIRSGRVKTDDLIAGELKEMLNVFATIDAKVENYLTKLGYEAG